MLALRPDVTSSFARAADIEELISLGAARVVIGILAVESPTEWERPVGRFGSSVCV
jgi:phosphoribosylformimino-5-aminoimidazole carboxamide ribonucleotide (ProFAR) isomerase